MTWLIAGRHSLHVEAFFCRRPDENHDRFYRFLLERNGRTYGVHFAVDQVGDVYLVGRLPLAAVAAEEIDRILGCVLSYADDNFDAALELGFASAIRREWAWRAKNGEAWPTSGLRPVRRPGSQFGAIIATAPGSWVFSAPRPTSSTWRDDEFQDGIP